MPLVLRRIYQPPEKSYNIVARNHHDNKMGFSAPNNNDYILFNRWLYTWDGCTELNITSVHGRAATVQLEDSNWNIIVTGNIEHGHRSTPISGSHDFDVKLTGDGRMQLQTTDGSKWGTGSSDVLTYVLVPFQA